MKITVKKSIAGGFSLAVAKDVTGNIVDLSNKLFDSKEQLEQFITENNYTRIPGVVIMERKGSTKNITLDVPEEVIENLIANYQVEDDSSSTSTITRERDPQKIAQRVKDALEAGQIERGRRGGLRYKDGKALTMSEVRYFEETFGKLVI